ncbi:hypothetical protein b3_0122 [Synechococcus phage B3]|nr:hypothetical protein b3_0122 [Synechococcus phage B3]QGT54736.1 hypothetical protein b23_0121 [Synechococcus phage B23]
MIKTMIPLGALCSQDFSVFNWPRASDHPETVFMGQKLQGGGFRLSAPGYGEPGNYGCGAIFVSKMTALIDSEGNRL